MKKILNLVLLILIFVSYFGALASFLSKDLVGAVALLIVGLIAYIGWVFLQEVDE